MNAADESTEDAEADGSDIARDQPLRAQWRPDVTSPERGPSAEGSGSRGTPRTKLRRLAAAYGWRLYAVPVLIAITVLVIVDTVTASGQAPAQQQTAANSAAFHSSKQQEPLATERRPDSDPVDSGTAGLPSGGDFTQKGKGTWKVLPGSTGWVGDGDKKRTYTIEVEKGIDPSSYAGNKAFAQAVEAVLADPRGWTGSGEVSFRRVDGEDASPDFRISLTTPKTDHKPGVCGYAIEYEASCFNGAKDRVVINLARWVRGAKAFNGDLSLYRQYAINHEVGHAIGNRHAGCPEDGALAPVMMQQTFGVSNDYVSKLNGTTSPVAPNGKVCEPSAWPYPEAGEDE